MPFPLAHRRFEAPLHARKRHRHRAYDRRRHHDGLRRVPPGRRPAGIRRQVARPHRAVARPLFRPLPPDPAQIRPLPGPVPHRAGMHLPRPACPGCGECKAIRCRRLRYRRTGRRRTYPRNVRNDRSGQRHTTGGSSALSDGRGYAGEHPRRHRTRRRHVRLRDADAQRPQRTTVHGRRRHQHPQQEVGGRLFADRSRRHGFRRHALFEGLPPPPDGLRRDARGSDRLAAQHRLLPAAGRRGARTHPRRGLCGVERDHGRETATKDSK